MVLWRAMFLEPSIQAIFDLGDMFFQKSSVVDINLGVSKVRHAITHTMQP